MGNPIQKSLSGNVIGLLSAVKIFTRCKVVLRGYEKSRGVKKINAYKKKLMKESEGTEKQEILNGVVKMLTKNNANTVEEYYDGETLAMSCNYAVSQGAINKNSQFTCKFYSDYAQQHSTYYFLALSMAHDFVTDKTESFVNSIAPQDMKSLKQHNV